jgi:hypothetical protein
MTALLSNFIDAVIAIGDVSQSFGKWKSIRPKEGERLAITLDNADIGHVLKMKIGVFVKLVCVQTLIQ